MCYRLLRQFSDGLCIALQVDEHQCRSGGVEQAAAGVGIKMEMAAHLPAVVEKNMGLS
ncbi:hypothetical protein ACLD9W_12115 [Neisseria sp. WLZKY-1]|uniref:hypothetical protein n=1 Tax=Neisseria sp. WLZKY-1 TaxID=3390377 RepID=UPI00397BE2E6